MMSFPPTVRRSSPTEWSQLNSKNAQSKRAVWHSVRLQRIPRALFGAGGTGGWRGSIFSPSSLTCVLRCVEDSAAGCWTYLGDLRVTRPPRAEEKHKTSIHTAYQRGDIQESTPLLIWEGGRTFRLSTLLQMSLFFSVAFWSFPPVVFFVFCFSASLSYSDTRHEEKWSIRICFRAVSSHLLTGKRM